MISLPRILTGALILASTAASIATAQPAACDRRCLEGFVDRYLDALVRHDPRAVPIAATARYTENGQRLVVGDGLWRSVKEKGKYRLLVSDTNAQQVAFIGTLEENNADPALSTPALVALRLKVAGKTRQIEATLERVPYGMTSGWSSWEDGMSDRARDVTR